MWVIWLALISGVLVLQFMLGRGIPWGENAPTSGLNPFLFVMGAQLVGATVVRWVVLPRARHPSQQLVFMIIGLALSEAVVIFEIFLLPADQPATRLIAFSLGMTSMLQFVPVYARPVAVENRLPGARDKRP